MDVIFSCSCGRSFRVPDRFSGRVVNCPACKQKVTIPEPEPTLRTIPLIEVASDERGGLQITVDRAEDPGSIPRRYRPSPGRFVTGFLTVMSLGLAWIAYPNALVALRAALARIIDPPRASGPPASGPAKEHRPVPPAVEAGDDGPDATK